MQRLKIDQDIKPLSEVKIGIADYIKQVRDTKRPVIITQHGKGVAVLSDASEYENMQEGPELLTNVQASPAQRANVRVLRIKMQKKQNLEKSQEMKILWSPPAIDRASGIAEYIALDKPTVADKWINTLFLKVEQLEFPPKSGRAVPEIGDEQFGELIYGNYRIICRIEKSKYRSSQFGMGSKCCQQRTF
jgi:prevent-host-death family protein